MSKIFKRTVFLVDNKLIEDFGSGFVQAFKTTHNYRAWAATEHPAFKDVQPGYD